MTLSFRPLGLAVLLLVLVLPMRASALGFEPSAWAGGPRLWVGNLNGTAAVGAQAERGFTKPGQYGPGFISGGVGADYYSWSYDYAFGGSYDYSVIPIQVFSNYHLVFRNQGKWDPYAGLSLVYSVVSASWDGPSTVSASASDSSFDIAAQLGTRYFIKPNFAAQAQIGVGYGTLGLGATWVF